MRHIAGCRRRGATLLLVFLLVTCTAAEEGVLVLRVLDMDELPVPELRIGTEGPGGSPQFTDQNGTARLRLPSNTKPAALVTLQIMGVWRGLVVQFVSPINRRVRVPPFEESPDNIDEVTVAKKHDLQVLEQGAGLVAVHAMADKPAAAPKPKPASPSQGRYRMQQPHFENVALRISDAASLPDEPTPTGIEEAADYFGLPPQAIADAIAKWGGTPLLWKMILVTGTLETGGSDPFRFVRASNNDVLFGIAPWSLRGCTLQPVLLKYEEVDSQRFAQIMDTDTDWVKKTMAAACEVSSKAAAERMLAGPNMLQPVWRKRFRQLGGEAVFQHAAVQHMMQQLLGARSMANIMGLVSDQAVAFTYSAVLQSGATGVEAQQTKLEADAAAFKQQFGRSPDEQEKLLMLANRLPQSPGSFVDRAQLFSQGSTSVLGQKYDLDEFGISFRDADTGVELALHKDGPALAKPAGDLLPAAQEFDLAAETQLFSLINKERAKHDLPPLQLDTQLTQAARGHTVQIAQFRALSHQLPGEPGLAQRYVALKIPTMLDGENVALGDSAGSAHSHLMDDLPHRDAILNPRFNAVGVGVIRRGSVLYVTEDFAHVVQMSSNEDAVKITQQGFANYAAQHGITLPAPTPSPDLQQMACNMAEKGAPDLQSLIRVPGARGAMAWSTPDPARLNSGAAEAASQSPSGYSLAACSKLNPTGPGVLYWIAMVTY